MGANIEFDGAKRSPKLTATTALQVLRAKQALSKKLGHDLQNWRVHQVLVDARGEHWTAMKCSACRAKLGYRISDAGTGRAKQDSVLIIEKKLEEACAATAQGDFFRDLPAKRASQRPRRKAGRVKAAG